MPGGKQSRAKQQDHLHRRCHDHCSAVAAATVPRTGLTAEHSAEPAGGQAALRAVAQEVAQAKGCRPVERLNLHIRRQPRRHQRRHQAAGIYQCGSVQAGEATGPARKGTAWVLHR